MLQNDINFETRFTVAYGLSVGSVAAFVSKLTKNLVVKPQLISYSNSSVESWRKITLKRVVRQEGNDVEIKSVLSRPWNLVFIFDNCTCSQNLDKLLA